MPNTNNVANGSRLLEQHFFLTMTSINGVDIDHLAGREYETTMCVGDLNSDCNVAAALSRVLIAWQHTTTGLPFGNSGQIEERKPRFVYPSQTDHYQDGQPLSRVMYLYDPARQGGYNLGNITEVQEFERDGAGFASVPLRTTYTWYYPNSASTEWIVNKPARRELYSYYAGYTVNGQVLSEIKRQTLFYYDQRNDYITPPSKGLLYQRRDGISPLYQYTQYDYWPNNGNPRTVTDGNNHVTETFYDSVFQAYPVCQVSNMTGWTWNKTIWRYYGAPGSGDQTPGVAHPCDNTAAGSALTTTGAFFGLMEETQDPNGAVVKQRYDPWGRLTKVIRPGDDDASPTVRYSYSEYNGVTAPFRMGEEHKESGANYLTTYTFYDGLGRVVQTQAEAATGGQLIVASNQYNASDQALKQHAPYLAAASLGNYLTPNWGMPNTQIEYDPFGRVTKVTNPDSTTVQSFYRYLSSDAYPQTAVVDEMNRQTISAHDDLDRLVSVKQYLGTVGGSPSWDAAVYAESQYTYDVADQLVQVVGPDGAVTTLAFDALGRKISLTDPDMGTWTYGYDAVGNLKRQTDARGQTVCFYYDALDRLLGKHARSGTTCPVWNGGTLAPLLARYYYDEPGYGASLGRRTRAEAYQECCVLNTISTSYDSHGRVITNTLHFEIDNTNYTTGYTYDAINRVLTMTYPDGEVVSQAYTTQGLLESVTGWATYVGDTLYNALGQVTERRLGSTSGVVKQLYSYTAAENFRLVTLQSGVSPSYSNLQSITYTYDDAGNVLSITDAAAYGGSQTQTFTYDGLNRLLTAQATGGSVGTYGQRSYAYNPAGNITSFEGVSFSYNDANHKHAVTHLNGMQRYWYDANGNTTYRTNSSNVDVDFVYYPDNLLMGMTTYSGTTTIAGISFEYDADGNLVKTINYPSTVTVHVGKYYERENGVVKKYYDVGGVRVALRTNGATYFLLADHLGSTAVTTDAAGARQTELRYYPYGAARYNPGSQLTRYRFTGQPWDGDTGLYDYGARWYDPLSGRFLSPDTIVPEPGNPQALNRYSYTLNNPVKYTDPSGHEPCMACVGGGGGGAMVAVLMALGQQAQALSVQMAPAANGLSQTWNTYGNAITATGDQIARAAAQHGGNAAQYGDGGNTAGPGGLEPNKLGRWVQRPEAMSDRARAYQRYVAGQNGDQVFQLNDVNFDGLRDGVLLDAKGYYKQFVDPATGGFNQWWRGANEFVEQAQRQIHAAKGAEIEWHFNEVETLEAVRKLFAENGIGPGISLILDQMP